MNTLFDLLSAVLLWAPIVILASTVLSVAMGTIIGAMGQPPPPPPHPGRRKSDRTSVH